MKNKDKAYRDIIQDLIIQKETFIAKDSNDDEEYPGYLQVTQCNPLKVIAFCKGQRDQAKSLMRPDINNVYIDATGSIVRPVDGKKVLLYEQ